MNTKLSSTFFAKPSYVIKKWLLIDANNQVLGRLAAQVTKILRGKHKAYFTPYINCGDNIVIINSDKIKLTGKKLHQKIYYRHTGFPGGINQIKAIDLLSGNYPDRLLRLAVKRMMPKESPLSRQQFKCMHIYASKIHPHSAQRLIITNLTK